MRNRLFTVLSLLIVALALGYWFWGRDSWPRPDPCTCADAYTTDSLLSLPASRRLVGNGYYVFTIQAARRHCDSVYQKAEISGDPLTTAERQRWYARQCDSLR